MRTLPYLLFGALSLVASARAEEAQPPIIGSDRYSMTPADGGFLRLDKQTGAVSYCAVKEGLSLCRASADERATLEAELARLRQENAELKSRIAEAPAARPSGSTLPSEEEFERTLSFTERFLRRIMRVFREEAPGQRS
jgi:hypothetical protein